MKAKAGNRAFHVTRELRHRVEVLRASGFLESGIALVLEISEHTLRKHFAKELANGALRADARIALALHAAAEAGNVNAARTWREQYAMPETKGKRSRQPPAVGKKERQQRESETAAQGTSWAELLKETESERPNRGADRGLLVQKEHPCSDWD